MRIVLRHNSDRLTLLTGNPRRLSLRYSTDPACLASVLPRREPDARKTVLLLGGNGFVGMHLLRELLADERVERVYALVRPPGATRITQQTEKYRLTLPDTGKLVVLAGSYLDPAVFASLQSEVDVVLDAVGATTHRYPYARYRQEKVLPTIRLAEFCLTSRFKTLHVIGSVGSEVYQRRRDFARRSFFFCGYSRMKFVVKHLALLANRDGVPIHVYQAPFTLGGPDTGFRGPGLEYSFWHIVRHMVRLGQAWHCDATIPVVAADVLSRAVLDNALSPAPRAITYPVTPVTMTELADRFGLKMVPWPEFRRNLPRAASSLFPPDLPDLLRHIDTAAVAVPHIDLPHSDLPPIDVLCRNARHIPALTRVLPVLTSELPAVA